jgi:hypothetical protein
MENKDYEKSIVQIVAEIFLSLFFLLGSAIIVEFSKTDSRIFYSIAVLMISLGAYVLSNALLHDLKYFGFKKQYQLNSFRVWEISLVLIALVFFTISYYDGHLFYAYFIGGALGLTIFFIEELIFEKGLYGVIKSNALYFYSKVVTSKKADEEKEPLHIAWLFLSASALFGIVNSAYQANLGINAQPVNPFGVAVMLLIWLTILWRKKVGDFHRALILGLLFMVTLVCTVLGALSYGALMLGYVFWSYVVLYKYKTKLPILLQFLPTVVTLNFSVEAAGIAGMAAIISPLIAIGINKSLNFLALKNKY